MRTLQAYGYALAFVACGNWVIPLSAVADQPRQPQSSQSVGSKPRLIQVALTSDGSMRGSLVNSAGQANGSQVVKAELIGKTPTAAVQTKTDGQGRFQLRGLKPGVYAVTVGDRVAVCCCWSHQAAPPSASADLLLVRGQMIERGQRPIADLLAGPVAIGAIIVAAVAIPVAIAAAQDDAT